MVFLNKQKVDKETTPNYYSIGVSIERDIRADKLLNGLVAGMVVKLAVRWLVPSQQHMK